MKLYRWKLAAADSAGGNIAEEYPQFAGLCGKLICARQKNTGQGAEEYLNTQTTLESPFALKDMEIAVQCIFEAIENGERIAVYGDYDCDGVTSTAVLFSYLEAIGADVLYYIPDREVEGYGMNNQAVKFLREVRGVDLIVTVDNGISAHEQIDYANSLGMRVVVTDHHTPHATLPNAVAVVDPHRADDESSFKNLAGVGVAFKLVAALEGENGEELMEHYGDLVAIGTVADIVELAGENRKLVKEGLKVLRNTHRPGLKALIGQAGLNISNLESENIAFGIAPRINAAGRMGDVYHALELLLTEGEDSAEELAAVLCEYNSTRKSVENEIVTKINTALEQNSSPLNERVLLIRGDNWHPGVIGIIASKMLERYGKPCFIISFKDGVGRSSGRSIPGVSIIDGLKHAGEHLEQFGGHMGAAGFTVLEEKYEQFKAVFLQYFAQNFLQMPQNTLTADVIAEPEDFDIAQIEKINSLFAPFGEGNPQPLYALIGFTIKEALPLSQGKYMRLNVTKRGKEFSAVWFYMPQARFTFAQGDKVDIIADISVNEFKGRKQLTIKIVDMHLSGFKQEAFFASAARIDAFYRGEPLENPKDMLPTREEVGAIYKFIKKTGKNGSLVHIYEHFDKTFMFEKFYFAVKCLEEFNFVKCSGGYINCDLELQNNSTKADLESSEILKAIKNYKI